MKIFVACCQLRHQQAWHSSYISKHGLLHNRHTAFTVYRGTTHTTTAKTNIGNWQISYIVHATHLCKGSVVHIPVGMMCTMEPSLNDVPHKSLGVV